MQGMIEEKTRKGRSRFKIRSAAAFPLRDCYVSAEDRHLWRHNYLWFHELSVMTGTNEPTKRKNMTIILSISFTQSFFIKTSWSYAHDTSVWKKHQSGKSRIRQSRYDGFLEVPICLFTLWRIMSHEWRRIKLRHYVKTKIWICRFFVTYNMNILWIL